MYRIVTIVQARMRSTRLPGKVLMPILGKPLLLRMLERVMRAKHVGTVVVATTTDEADLRIVDLCENEGVRCFRGHETDLLDRHYQVARLCHADAVVKIPSDCPLIDPFVIDKVLTAFLEHRGAYDYVSNLHPATFPDGNDVEIMTTDALRMAWLHARRDFEREHTTPYIWENPHLFEIENVVWDSGRDFSMTHRWTIDYEEDYRFIRSIFEHLYPAIPHFTMNDILQLLREKPGLGKLNDKYAGVNWYRHHLSDLQTIKAHQTKCTGA